MFEFSAFPQPLVGFIGAISGYKLDFALIRQMVMSRPQYQFVFIGKVGEGDPWTDIQDLQDLPNLHFIGPKAYSDLPAYLHQFAACLLPCAINEYTRNMFPMKFFEYLAAGRPVVTTPLPALASYGDLCYIAATADELAACLDRIIHCPDTDKIQRGVAEAGRNTYLARTRTMLDMLGIGQ